MNFTEVELVMCNDGTFYRAFTGSTTTGGRLYMVGRYFKYLFPNETVTDKKIRTLRIHFEKLWLNIQPPEETSQPFESTTTAMSGDTMPAPKTKLLQTVHYVNGVDVTALTDDQLISVIREREMEIAKLQSNTHMPARLKNRAAELQAELNALVEFLDNLDRKPA